MPSSAPQRHDEPPFDDVPPPFDDDVPPEMDAPADERVPSYSAQAEASVSQASSEPGGQPRGSNQSAAGQRNSGQQGAGQPNAGQPRTGQPNTGQQGGASPRQHPNASAPRSGAKDPSRAPSFTEKQRYGEAVVREVLGATFIEEQPYTAAPRTRNDY